MLKDVIFNRLKGWIEWAQRWGFVGFGFFLHYDVFVFISRGEIYMETVTIVIHFFYSNEVVMKNINEKCDWKVSSSFILKDIRYHIYESVLCGEP